MTSVNEIALGEIKLLEEIGSGGFGRVHKAKMHPFKHFFAVKILDPHPFNSHSEIIRERFIQEAYVLMNLRHPYIVPIYCMGEHQEDLYILMEYFNGFNLQNVRKEFGTPSPEKILPFITRIASALSHAHSRNIVHRDIKPTNLLLTKEDARIIDFGISAIIDPLGERFTRTGGTPVGDAFAAPELFDDPRSLDPRNDIYSLAACWFWLLTGATPRGRNWESLLRPIEGMTPAYEAVLFKGLEQIERRHQTAEELMHDIAHMTSDQAEIVNTKEILDEVAELTLGLIFRDTTPYTDPISEFKLEQNLGGYVSRFKLKLAIRALLKNELIRTVAMENSFGEPWNALEPTEDGNVWIEKNHSRIEAHLEDLEAHNSASRDTSGYDDVPF